MSDQPSTQAAGQVELKFVRGREIAGYLDAVAALRIAVFREFPYLYDGDTDYERRYLRTYVESPQSFAVLVLSKGVIVGASTCLPLAHEEAAFQRPFRELGLDPRDIFYLAESILLPPFRGRGLGTRFFHERENHARRLGEFTHTAFCAVERPADHPRRPADHRPLDGFWTRRGYRKMPRLQARFPWRDLGDSEETEKTLVFWMRPMEASHKPRAAPG